MENDEVQNLKRKYNKDNYIKKEKIIIALNREDIDNDEKIIYLNILLGISNKKYKQDNILINTVNINNIPKINKKPQEKEDIKEKEISYEVRVCIECGKTRHISYFRCTDSRKKSKVFYRAKCTTCRHLASKKNIHY